MKEQIYKIEKGTKENFEKTGIIVPIVYMFDDIRKTNKNMILKSSQEDLPKLKNEIAKHIYVHGINRYIVVLEYNVRNEKTEESKNFLSVSEYTKNKESVLVISRDFEKDSENNKIIWGDRTIKDRVGSGEWDFFFDNNAKYDEIVVEEKLKIFYEEIDENNIRKLIKLIITDFGIKSKDVNYYKKKFDNFLVVSNLELTKKQDFANIIKRIVAEDVVKKK